MRRKLAGALCSLALVAGAFALVGHAFGAGDRPATTVLVRDAISVEGHGASTDDWVECRFEVEVEAMPASAELLGDASVSCWFATPGIGSATRCEHELGVVHRSGASTERFVAGSAGWHPCGATHPVADKRCGVASHCEGTFATKVTWSVEAPAGVVWTSAVGTTHPELCSGWGTRTVTCTRHDTGHVVD